MIALGGMLAALALLAVGLLLLPAGESAASSRIFIALWLLVTGISALSFGRELWRAWRLKQIRRRWRSASKGSRRPLRRKFTPADHLRERERHLD